MSENLIKELGESLDYDSETGDFYWKVDRGSKVRKGDRAGFIDNREGRFLIRFKGRNYFAHRLAWLFIYGSWPNAVIDHIDGDKLNNKISNLRDVSVQVNQQNKRKPMSNNTSGYLGVSLRKNKYIATISVNGKTKYLGYFTTPEEAHAAYLAAKREVHEGCTI